LKRKDEWYENGKILSEWEWKTKEEAKELDVG